MSSSTVHCKLGSIHAAEPPRSRQGSIHAVELPFHRSRQGSIHASEHPRSRQGSIHATEPIFPRSRQGSIHTAEPPRSRQGSIHATEPIFPRSRQGSIHTAEPPRRRQGSIRGTEPPYPRSRRFSIHAAESPNPRSRQGSIPNAEPPNPRGRQGSIGHAESRGRQGSIHGEPRGRQGSIHGEPHSSHSRHGQAAPGKLLKGLSLSNKPRPPCQFTHLPPVEHRRRSPKQKKDPDLIEDEEATRAYGIHFEPTLDSFSKYDWVRFPLMDDDGHLPLVVRQNRDRHPEPIDWTEEHPPSPFEQHHRVHNAASEEKTSYVPYPKLMQEEGVDADAEVCKQLHEHLAKILAGGQNVTAIVNSKHGVYIKHQSSTKVRRTGSMPRGSSAKRSTTLLEEDRKTPFQLPHDHHKIDGYEVHKCVEKKTDEDTEEQPKTEEVKDDEQHKPVEEQDEKQKPDEEQDEPLDEPQQKSVHTVPKDEQEKIAVAPQDEQQKSVHALEKEPQKMTEARDEKQRKMVDVPKAEQQKTSEVPTEEQSLSKESSNEFLKTGQIPKWMLQGW